MKPCDPTSIVVRCLLLGRGTSGQQVVIIVSLPNGSSLYGVLRLPGQGDYLLQPPPGGSSNLLLVGPL